MTAPDVGPVEVVGCEGEAAVGRVRDRLLDSPSSLDGGPLIRSVVARRPDEDVLLVNHSHVLADAVGGLRLLASVDRAYRGVPDPAPAVEVATARSVLAPTSAPGIAGLLGRWSTGMQLAAAASLPRCRVAPQGGGAPGFGIVVRTVDATLVAAQRARLRASFDAHLVAAIHVTIDRWNKARGLPDGRVGTAFGVNLRPTPWVHDVVANLAGFVSVVTEPGQREDVATALGVASPAMEPEARAKRARLAVEASRATSVVPLDVRRRMFSALPADQFDSIAVSNLGPVEAPSFGGGRTGIWAAAPAVPPVGISVLVLTTGSELRIATAFRRERFDDDGALAFTDALIACLVGG